MQKYYKYEMHCHTAVCSACDISSATEMVDAAARCGYQGIVFNNHSYMEILQFRGICLGKIL